MKKSTAINIFKGMIITILALVIGLAVVISMFERSQARVEEIEHQYEILQEVHLFVGEGIHLEYVGDYNCTAYCTEKYKHICGTGDGITASGQPVQAGVSVAVGDTDKFPYGTILYIEGVGFRIVQDTGGGLEENQIDLAMGTHEEALNWGHQDGLKVYVVKDGNIK